MDPLVTSEDLAAYLQRDLDRSSAELAVAGASGAVRGYCRWDLAHTEETFVVDGSGGRLLTLPTLRLVSVEEIRVDGAPLDAGTYTWSAGGQLHRDAGWPRRFRAVEVDCHHGYAPIPDEVCFVALDCAAHVYANPEHISTSAVGAVSLSYDFRPVDMARLDPYRLP